MSNATISETMNEGARSARLQAEVRAFFADPGNRERFRERSVAVRQMAGTVAEAIGLSDPTDMAALGEVVGCLLVMGELENDDAEGSEG